MQSLFSPRRQAFINGYVDALFVDGKPAMPNVRQIAIDAGYAEKNADISGYHLLAVDSVQEAIREKLRDVATKSSIDLQQIIQRWADIAMADPRKIAKLRRINCRYCYGIGHKYQWDADEYARTVMQSMADNPEAMPPLMEGGDGWQRVRVPHPYCPKCQGEGEDDYFVQDMDKLDGPEQYLIAGIKMTRYGPEVVLHSQMDALANLAKCMGAFVERREHTGKDGKPIAIASVNVEVPADPQQASKLYQMLMEGKTE